MEQEKKKRRRKTIYCHKSNYSVREAEKCRNYPEESEVIDPH